MIKTLAIRLEKAFKQDPKICCTPPELDNHPGSSTEYLNSLGLSKRDLKALERMGFAIRGRTKNVWVSGETAPNGQVVGGALVPTPMRLKRPYRTPQGYIKWTSSLEDVNVPSKTLRGSGSRLRWIIVQSNSVK